MSKKLDLTGQRFGRLMAICESEKRTVGQRVTWNCICDCGNFKEVKTHELRNGNTKSCGCLHGELASKRAYKHGESGDNKTRLYVTWIGMKNRCYNPNITGYRWYGGKGIEVCKEWKGDYVAFKNWALNSGYEDNLEINRIKSNGNYEPSNCQWITRSENIKLAIKERVANSIPIRFTTA